MENLISKKTDLLSRKARIGNSSLFKGDGVCGVCLASKKDSFGFAYLGSKESKHFYLPFCAICENACCRWYIDFIRYGFDLENAAVKNRIAYLEEVVKNTRLSFIGFANIDQLKHYIGNCNPFVNKRFDDKHCAVCTDENPPNRCDICKSHYCTDCSVYFFHSICAGCRFDAARICLALISSKFMLDAPLVKGMFAEYAQRYRDGALPLFTYDVTDMLSNPPLSGNFFRHFLREDP